MPLGPPPWLPLLLRTRVPLGSPPWLPLLLLTRVPLGQPPWLPLLPWPPLLLAPLVSLLPRMRARLGPRLWPLRRFLTPGLPPPSRSRMPLGPRLSPRLLRSRLAYHALAPSLRVPLGQRP